MSRRTLFLSLSLILVALTVPAAAQDPPAIVPDPDQKALFDKFAKTMTNARLVGQFTLLGRENNDLMQEEYTVESARKLPTGDLWLITARIRYGDKDLKLPMPLPVKWAGDTPVISLTDVTLPGLGTFSSRVVIDGNKYAGTWSHGDKGGHLFGTIEKLNDAAPNSGDQ